MDFPEPDGPMIDTISPRSIDQAHIVEGGDLAFSLEPLGDVFEHNHNWVPRQCSTSPGPRQSLSFW